MKKPKFSYRKSFIEARKKRYEDQQDYLEKHGVFEEEINAKQHPEFFEIEKRWIATRKKLDAPLIKDAYYRIDHMVSFVKTNIYTDYQDIKNGPIF